MELTKLGKYIVQLDARNSAEIYGEDAVIGLSTQKEIISTKADLNGVSLSSYKLFPPRHFAYVPDTSRRGDKISLAYNSTSKTYLVSAISVVFLILNENKLLPDYLFIYFNRTEFDRYARFNSWGSARETFSWEEMCDVEIAIPPIGLQQKYVDIYNAMVENQKAYERGLEDLRLVFEGYVENIKKKVPCEKIGTYLIESDKRNDIGLQIDSVRGLTTSKELIPTKADLNGVSLTNYKVMLSKQIAYVPDTSRRGDKVSLGFNNTNDDFLVSSISIVFSTKLEKLLPEYLMLFLIRSEFDRYARFNSWGSARETFGFDDMCDVKIPIPDINIQKAISGIYAAYVERKEINELLKEQIKNICSILIKGSLNEAEERLEAER
ncbi:MAG: restriction endonuclease subunit S [Lachnospiraceae bacterium]|nr:restriction endonuclease subunit S [Lachnospiraceae bacterium]